MYDGYVQIGTIARAHGLKGELILHSEWDEFPDKLDKVYLESKQKQLIPYRLLDITYRPKSGRNSFFLKLEHVETRSVAEKLAPMAVYVAQEDAPQSDESDTHFSDITGWKIFNEDELFGEIVDVFETPAHFVIEIHHHTGSVLVPWVDEYIQALDDSSHSVYARFLERFL